MKRYGFWLTAGAVIALDQWTKSLVMAHLPPQEPKTLIPGLLWFTHVRNPGVAFGQLAGGGALLSTAAIVAAVFIILYRWRFLRRGAELHPALALGLALPLGGAIGNAIDRIQWKTVTDFIDFGWFPVFNVADIAITFGAIALLIYFVIVQPREEHAAEMHAAEMHAAEMHAAVPSGEPDGMERG